MIPLTFNLQLAGTPGNLGFSSQAASQFCQQGDVGIQFVVYVLDQNGDPVNLSAATNLQINLQVPDGTVEYLTASLLTNGMDGGITFTTIAGTLAEAGTWAIQAAFQLSGSTFNTQLGVFQVNANVQGIPFTGSPMNQITLIDANGVSWTYTANTDGRLITSPS